jgi:hypothetical protein
MHMQRAEAATAADDVTRGDSDSFLVHARSWWITPFVVVFLAFGMISLSGQQMQPSDEARELLLDQGRAIALQPAATAAIAQR